MKIMNQIIEELIYLYKTYTKEPLTVPKLKENIDGRQVVLYGAGYLGITLCRGFREIGVFPAAFIDKNPQKQGTTIEGLPIISPEEIKNRFGEVFIVVSMYRKDTLFDDIKKMLNSLGNDKVLHVLQLRSCWDLMKNQPLPIAIDGELLINSWQDIELFYEMLHDVTSKEIFISLLKFMFISVDTYLNAESIEKQYFDYGIYKRLDNEYFIDCGAFDGEVMEIFLKNNSYNFYKYIAFEPDPDNFMRLQRRILDMGNPNFIYTYNLALGDKSEILRFENFGQANSAVSIHGKVKVEARRLDDILKDNPTFIKIDVEGYERQVIEGGIELINKSRPILAVAVYHRASDLWELPIWIKKLFPDYRLFLRTYMNLMETVCYAVPEERISK